MYEWILLFGTGMVCIHPFIQVIFVILSLKIVFVLANNVDADEVPHDVSFHLGLQYLPVQPGLEVIKLEYSLKLKIKRNDWLLANTCPQAANHCVLF